MIIWHKKRWCLHAKNFSIRPVAQGRYRLTPLYDVLSAWPIAGPRHNQVHPKKLKLAMSVRDKTKHYRIDEIKRRHFNATVRQCGIGPDIESIIDEVVAKTKAVIDRVGASVPKGFPEEVFSSVTGGCRRAPMRCSAGRPERPATRAPFDASRAELVEDGAGEIR